MAIGDVFQLTMFSNISSQQCVNVFFYRQMFEDGGSDANSEQLADAFYARFFAPSKFLVSGFISTDLHYTALRVENIFNVNDFYELSVDHTGGGAGSYMPVFNAYYFRTMWMGSGLRRGMKRFAGVVEEAIQDGRVDASPLPDAFLEMASDLGSPLLVTAEETFMPLVVKRIKETDVKGNVIYRLPENYNESLASRAAEQWEFVNSITTQNSRKIGRGS